MKTPTTALIQNNITVFDVEYPPICNKLTKCLSTHTKTIHPSCNFKLNRECMQTANVKLDEIHSVRCSVEHVKYSLCMCSQGNAFIKTNSVEESQTRFKTNWKN